LTVSTFDGALTDTDTVAITVNPVSDPPVNTVPGAQSVNEDTTLLITGVSVADVDSMALTATLTVAHGTLSATGTGVSGSGSATLTIAGTDAEINAALGTLSYLGAPNFHGADTLTVVTSDGSLSDTDTVPITVQAVNDVPVNTVPLAQTVDEDTVLPIAGLSVADMDSLTLVTTLTVGHGALTATGTGVSGSGTATMSVAGTAAQINAALATLGYLGNPDFDGSDTLTVTTSDSSLSDTDTVAITVNAVNDPPANTVPGAQSGDEDTTLPIAGVSVVDVDSAALGTTINVTSGTLTVATGGSAVITGNGSGTVTVSGTAAEINTALAGLSYLGGLNFNGADTLTVSTSDGALTDIDTVAITVNAADDAPVNTVPLAQSVNEDTPLPIAGVSVADVDIGALTTTLSVTSGILNVTAGPGVSGNGTGTVTITGTAAQINAALAGLSYLGGLNFTGADTLTVSTSDGSLTDTDTVAITVNPVSDPPVNTVPGAQSVNEDTALPIAGVSVADVDSTALSATLTVAHGTLTATGTGVRGSGSATLMIAGTAAQINTALAGLSYLGDPNFHGGDTLTVVTSDGSLSDTDTVPITVQAVNDVPVNTVPPAQTVDEDTVLPIAGLSIADVDSPVLHTTLSVAHGTLTAAGASAGARLSASGTNTIVLVGTAAEINTALGTLTYLGDPGFNGADTLTVITSDGASNDTDTMAITVNAVNDPPVNTVPGALSINEDAILPIGASVADVDSAALTMTLSVASGTLNVTTGGGATIGGNGSGSVTIGGTAAQVNSALAGLSYRGNLNFNGADTLTVITSDGSLSDTDTVPITVNAVNDPAGQHRARRTERQRGRDAADDGRLGRGRGQQRAHRPRSRSRMER
jgi:VCBS repeat-containing protein